MKKFLAFAFMPQFKLSTAPLVQLWPMFTHMVASSFASAGLIPTTHPALAEYGRSYPLRRLIGEAIAACGQKGTSRSSYAVLAAVMMMIAAIFGAIGAFFMLIVGAHPAVAQMFAHPLGDSSIDGYRRGSDSFDLEVPAAGTPQGDYGLMMLDKVLRAGANGKGVPLQNALREVMMIYNSAMLVIASVIVFWMIVSIVVDTAKTGQVGGNRHNMVWFPIRFVFALALLFPLGSAGFSSGQFMVMKLAEWGNNLGTNAWVAYVDGVIQSEKLVADYVPEGVTPYVKDLARVWICSASLNAQLELMKVPERVQSIKRPSPMPNTYVREWHLPTGGTCGAMTVEHGIAYTETVSGADALSRSIQVFKTNMRSSYVNAMLAAEPQIKAFACRFVSQHAPYQNDAGALAVLNSTPDCKSASYKPLAAGSFAEVAELEAIVGSVGRTIANDYRAGIDNLRGYSTGNALIEDMKARGWAGMGAWYHRIAQLNAAAAALTEAPISVTGGNLTNDQSLAPIEHARVVVADYDKWWLSSTLTAAAATVDEGTGAARTDALEPAAIEAGSSAVLSGIMSANPRKILNVLVDQTGITNTWLAAGAAWSGKSDNADMYPLAMIAYMGDRMVLTGTLMNGIVLGVHALMALGSTSIGGFNFNFAPLASSYAFQLIPKIGMAFVIAGMMLKFYIPLIPFMRVIFAVLTWIISVFEAVMMVPVAAIAHLNSEGEGLAGQARTAWILWLNILLRPILVVIGFIGALLIYNAWVSFFTDNFIRSLNVGLPTGGFAGLLTFLSLAIVYVFIMYTAANMVFKLLDIIPNGLMRWLGGSADISLDNDGDRGVIWAASNLLNQGGGRGIPKAAMPPKGEQKDGMSGKPAAPAKEGVSK